MAGIVELRNTALSNTPISVPEWQEMWRLFSVSSPMPIVLDLPRSAGVRSLAERDDERRRAHALLVRGGYAVEQGEQVRLSDRTQDALRVLARPHREVDLRMTIRGQSVRVLAAAARGGKVVRVTIRGGSADHDSSVAIESVDTAEPELAAVAQLPASPGPGRIRGLTIPVDGLARAIDGYRSDHFIDTLRKHVGKAAGDVHDLVRRDHTLRAKFGVAALDDRDGTRVRHPSALVVHDSSAGRHVLARRGGYLTVDRIDDRQIPRMLGQRLAAAAQGRC